MKVLAVFLVLMVIGGQTAHGADLTLRETWDDLVNHLKGFGQHAVQKLKELANHVSNETLQKLITALKNGDTSSIIGKREINLRETWIDLVNHLKGLGQHTIDKLKEMTNTVSSATLAKLIEALKTGNGVELNRRSLGDNFIEKLEYVENLAKTLKEKYPGVADKIEELVEKYPEIAAEVLTRYAEFKDKLPVVVDKVLSIQKQITDKLQGHADKLNQILGQGAQQLKDIIEQVKDNGFHDKVKDTISSIFGKIKATVGLTKRRIEMVKRNVLNDIDSHIETLASELYNNNVISKRDVEIFRREASSKVKDFFKPHIEKLKQHITKIGQHVNNNVYPSLKDNIKQLQEKLQVHGDKLQEHGKTMVGHGKNAVTALKTAVTQILGQTFVDMAGTTIDALDTIKDAVLTITDHVSGATGVKPQ